MPENVLFDTYIHTNGEASHAKRAMLVYIYNLIYADGFIATYNGWL